MTEKKDSTNKELRQLPIGIIVPSDVRKAWNLVVGTAIHCETKFPVSYLNSIEYNGRYYTVEIRVLPDPGDGK